MRARPNAFVAAFVALAVLPSASAASDLCRVVALMSEVPGTSDNTGLIAPPPGLPGGANCGRSVGLTGSVNRHCSWSFPFRSEQAQLFFDDLDSSLSSCGDTDNNRDSEKPVNHPDTYHQIAYTNGDVSVTVSLKDKSALGETYVFLRVARSNEAK